MKIASIADLKARLSDYVEDTQSGPVVVMRNGKPVAALVAVDDEDDLEGLLMAHSPRLRAILDRSYQQVAEGRSLPHDEFWAKVEASHAKKTPPKPARRKPRGRKKTETD